MKLYRFGFTIGSNDDNMTDDQIETFINHLEKIEDKIDEVLRNEVNRIHPDLYVELNHD